MHQYRFDIAKAVLLQTHSTMLVLLLLLMLPLLMLPLLLLLFLLLLLLCVFPPVVLTTCQHVVANCHAFPTRAVE